MIKRITLTEDHIKLLKLIKFKNIMPLQEYGGEPTQLSIDKQDPYMLSGRLEDIAITLGLYDKRIPGSEDDAEGAMFPDDVEDYLVETHKYIIDNIYDIERLIHQLAFEGGITPGTYKAIDSENIWSKEC
jgi:hypothetical protein